MALTPIALIPQVVLGGLMVPMTTNSLLKWPMYVTPARWGFEGVVAQERKAIADGAAWVMNLGRTDTSRRTSCWPGSFGAPRPRSPARTSTAAGLRQLGSCLAAATVLGGMTILLLIVILIVLRTRDSI